MIAIPSRHRSLTLLASVIVAQVLLLAVQIKRERDVRLIRVWAVELISPIQRSVSWTIYGVEHGWGGYIGLRRAQKDNEALPAELDRWKIRNAELEGAVEKLLRTLAGAPTAGLAATKRALYAAAGRHPAAIHRIATHR